MNYPEGFKLIVLDPAGEGERAQIRDKAGLRQQVGGSALAAVAEKPMPEDGEPEHPSLLPVSEDLFDDPDKE